MKRRSALGTLLVILGAAGLAYAFLSGGKSPLEGLIPWFRQEVHIERTIEASSLQKLEIKSGSTNVRLVKSAGDQLHATVAGHATKNYAKNIALAAETRGDRLELAVDNAKGFRVGFNWSNLTMTVEVPDKLWDELSIDVGSGNIALADLKWNEVRLKAGSGNIAVENTTAAELTTKVGSGNLKLVDVSGGEFELNTSSGNVSVEGYEARRIEFSVSSGNVKFKDGSGELNGKTSSGNIELDLKDILNDTTLTANSGNVTVALDRTPESLAVSYKGGSGRGRIQKDGFRYEDTRDRDDIEGAFGPGAVKLKVSTGSGNFTLK